MSSDVISLVDQIYKVLTTYITNSLFLERILEFFPAHYVNQQIRSRILKKMYDLDFISFTKTVRGADKNRAHFYKIK